MAGMSIWSQARAAFASIVDGAEAIGPFRRFDGASSRVMIVSKQQAGPFAVIVCHHTAGSDDERNQTSTIASFASPDLDLVSFCLAPRIAANPLMQVVGWMAFACLFWLRFFMKGVHYPEIDMRGRRRFADLYTLASPSPDHVREIFRDDVLGFFEAHPGWSAEAITGQILIWREDVMEPPSRHAAFLEEAAAVAALFLRRES